MGLWDLRFSSASPFSANRCKPSWQRSIGPEIPTPVKKYGQILPAVVQKSQLLLEFLSTKSDPITIMPG